MSVAPGIERIAEASPRFKARIAGILYFFSLLTAGLTETFVRGPLNVQRWREQARTAAIGD